MVELAFSHSQLRSSLLLLPGSAVTFELTKGLVSCVLIFFTEQALLCTAEEPFPEHLPLRVSFFPFVFLGFIFPLIPCSLLSVLHHLLDFSNPSSQSIQMLRSTKKALNIQALPSSGAWLFIQTNGQSAPQTTHTAVPTTYRLS